MVPSESAGERLQKVLAQAGHGSRREIERWISQGRISVNGQPANLGLRVSSRDKIIVDGKIVRLIEKTSRTQVIALNKPEGVICTASDPQRRPTAESLLPNKEGIRWIGIGRLDINTSGLLLFTNNGDLAHQLMHPSFQIDREYAVRIFGDVTAEILARFRSGVEIDGESYAFEDVVRGNGRGANRWYYCIVRQGRNREIRKVWESQGLQVSRLIRSRFGNVMLPRDLKPGRHFEVKGVMLDDLYRLVNFQGRRSR
jgi:23S rRNA pseudouridine2605 synthase